MQLVLSNNRIIAHGENFLSMGGVVINTETGAKYENATIAECNGDCPSDIDKVGYEYHAGVFVPCAPFGRGNNNGYFMEVCETCATPRNSGILVRDLKWDKIASINCVVEETADEVNAKYTFPITEDALYDYSMLRYKIKAGSVIQIGEYYEYKFGNETQHYISKGNYAILSHSEKHSSSSSQVMIENKIITFEKDYIVPFYLTQHGNYYMEENAETPSLSTKWYDSKGEYSAPLDEIKIYLPSGENYYALYNKANIVIELEGRK